MNLPDKDKKNKSVKVAEDLLPGEKELKRTVQYVYKKHIKGLTLKDDISAGLTVAMNEIPDGMACGLLAGFSPVMGLFAVICGGIVGGIFNGSKLMIISTTSASAFLLFQLTKLYPEGQRMNVMMLLVLTSGILMIILGLLKFGNMVRFVSYSVMTGFLVGISILTILSQLPVLFSIEVEGANKILQTINLVEKIDLLNWHSVIAGTATVILLILLPKSPLGHKSAILSIALPSLVIYLQNWNDVEIVTDVSLIPDGLPPLQLPDLSLLGPEIFSEALSLSLISLVQAAGVSQSVPNPDGSRSKASKDFISQGIANISSGFFGGIAVGGSLGSTSLNILSGARSKWSGIFSGILILILIMLFPGLVGNVAMPVLAGVMIFAMAHTLKFEELKQIWDAGWTSRTGLVFTFIITLFLPIQYAVLTGILLSFTLYFFISSRLVKLQSLHLLSDGTFEEIKIPSEIKSRSIYIFTIDGGLHFAGARMLEKQWPKVNPGVKHPVVILELKGRNNIGATLTEVIESFYTKIKSAEGKLYLTELGENSYTALSTQAESNVLGGIKMKKKLSIVSKSTREAVLDAQRWLDSVAFKD